MKLRFKNAYNASWYGRSVDEARQDAQKDVIDAAMRDGLACVVCRQLLKNTGQFVKKDGLAYHLACLQCDRCKNRVPIASTQNYVILNENGKLLCETCKNGGTAPVGEVQNFCSSCGHPAKADASYCIKCGNHFK